MTGRKNVKCAKCGITSKEDSLLTFHRFPLPSKQHGPLRAKVWAKFCFPNQDWESEELTKLHSQHKMLCSKHFDDTSYIRNGGKKLNNFAIPTEAQSILSQLREEQDTCKLQENIPCSDTTASDKTPDAECSIECPLQKDDNVISEVQELREASPSPVSEEPDVPVELKEVCRICLAFNVKMYRVQEYNLCQMIYDVTGIKVRENEGIFSNVCFECAARLSAASAFRDKAIKSDGIMQRLLKSTDAITANEITILKENHEILKPILTVQEVFYTTDIDEDDPNNINPDLMDVDDQQLHPDGDTSLNCDVRNTFLATKTVGIISEKHKDIVKTYCDVETIDNLTLTERSMTMNDDGSITIENIQINDQQISDFNDRQDLVEHENDSTTIDEQNSSKVDDCNVITNEVLTRRVIDRFKELKCRKLADLAKEFGVTTKAVQKMLNNAGFKTQPIKNPDKEKKKVVPRINEEQKKRVITLKQDGVTISEISKQTGVSRAYVSKIWQRWCKENKEQAITSIENDENIIIEEFADHNVEISSIVPLQEYIEQR